MKKCFQRGLALAAMTGIVLAARAQDATIDQSQYPTILQQPVDQCLPVGSTAIFSVVATNVDTYQWYKNSAALDGQTNSSLTLSNLTIDDVAYYGASVIKGSDSVPTRMANLNVYTVSTSTTTTTTTKTKTSSTMTTSTMTTGDLTGGSVITIFGTPVISSGGTSTGCPGKYSGYVSYTKPTSQGWGWAPSTNTTSYSMSDTNRTDTKVQYGGYYGDSGCAATTVTVPYPAMSPVYRFSVYFPQGVQVPTNVYPIVLSGFDP